MGNDKSTFAIADETGPSNKNVEYSVAAIDGLRLPIDRQEGAAGTDGNTIFTAIFTGSASRFKDKGTAWYTGRKLPNQAQINALGQQLMQENQKSIHDAITNTKPAQKILNYD